MNVLGLSMTALSKKAGDKNGTLVKSILYGRSKSPRGDTLAALADALGCTIADLTGEGRRIVRAQQPDHLPAYSGAITSGVIEIGKTDYVAIGRYDAALSAGPGAIVDPNAEPIGYALIEAQWLAALTRAAPDHLAVLRVDNDSMESTLYSDDWVLLDRSQKNLRRTGIYGLQVDDVTWVKRVELNLQSKLITIISDNPRYPQRELPEEEVLPLGKVLSVVARRLR